MTLSELRELLSVLREFGVTAYAFKDISIELKPHEQAEEAREELDDVVSGPPPHVHADGLTEEEQLMLYGKVMP